MLDPIGLGRLAFPVPVVHVTDRSFRDLCLRRSKDHRLPLLWLLLLLPALLPLLELLARSLARRRMFFGAVVAYLTIAPQAFRILGTSGTVDLLAVFTPMVTHAHDTAPLALYVLRVDNPIEAS